MLSLTIIGALITKGVLSYTPEALADQILPGTLPGSEKLNINFNQFSGYLTVGGSKNMHYWLVESMNSPSTDPSEIISSISLYFIAVNNFNSSQLLSGLMVAPDALGY
jgi:hypothetical protein